MTKRFATCYLLDGIVVGRSMQRHLHPESIRFLNAVEALVPTGKVVVRATMDSYVIHKQPRFVAWLARVPH